MTFKLIAVYVPSKNVEETTAFYSALIGLDTARSLSNAVESYYAPLTPNGTWLWVSKPQHVDADRLVAYFAVDDLDAAVDLAISKGGKPISSPMEMPIAPSMIGHYEKALKDLGVVEPISGNLGRFQLFLDPSGCVIGLIQVEPHSHIFYGLGKYAIPLSKIQLDEHHRGIELGKQISNV